MIDEICRDPMKMMLFMLAGQAFLATVEYWLGRTDKVEAGSVLELILISLRGLLRLVFKKKTS